MEIELDEYFVDVQTLVDVVDKEKYDIIVAVGRGGLIPALYLSKQHNKPMVCLFARRYKGNTPESKTYVSHITGLYELTRDDRILLVDDITDAGTTLNDIKGILYAQKYMNVRTAVVYWRGLSEHTPDFHARKLNTEDGWVVFPYDKKD